MKSAAAFLKTRQMQVLVTVLMLGFALGSRAETPEGFDLQAWQAWVTSVVADGAVIETDSATYRTVSRINPADVTRTHHADYFSAVGGNDNQGHFVTQHIEDVSEEWKMLGDGTRDIDQWLFQASVVGDLLGTHHMHLVESADGAIISDDVVPVTSDEAMARWVAQLNFWYAVTTGHGSPFPLAK